MNWIVSLIVGILIGQEAENLPRVQPILKKCLLKTIEFLNDKNNIPSDGNETDNVWTRFFKFFKYFNDS